MAHFFGKQLLTRNDLFVKFADRAIKIGALLAQAEAGAGVEPGDATEELLHVVLPQSARIVSSQVLRVLIMLWPTAVWGAKMSHAWNAPDQTCSSASPPAFHRASA